MPMSKNIKDAILGNVTNVNKNKSILKTYFKISILKSQCEMSIFVEKFFSKICFVKTRNKCRYSIG